MGNLGNSANAASRHLSRLTGNRAAAESALQIDRLIRSSCVGQELLAAVEDFQLFTVPSDEKSSVIDALVIRSIRLGFARLSRLRPRSLWGVTPIIQLANCAKADRMLGIEAETLVDFSPREGFADVFSKRFGQIAMNFLLENGAWSLK